MDTILDTTDHHHQWQMVISIRKRARMPPTMYAGHYRGCASHILRNDSERKSNIGLHLKSKSGKEQTRPQNNTQHEGVRESRKLETNRLDCKTALIVERNITSEMYSNNACLLTFLLLIIVSLLLHILFQPLTSCIAHSIPEVNHKFLPPELKKKKRRRKRKKGSTSHKSTSCADGILKQCHQVYSPIRRTRSRNIDLMN